MNRIVENFDENHMASFYSDYLKKDIMIIISDELNASEERLTYEYKERISIFINNISEWYCLVCDAVLHWAKSKFNVILNTSDIELMIIYVLFEPFENGLYGLLFRLSIDIEHGCGIQIAVQNDDYRIIKIGTGDLAFEF